MKRVITAIVALIAAPLLLTACSSAVAAEGDEHERAAAEERATTSVVDLLACLPEETQYDEKGNPIWTGAHFMTAEFSPDQKGYSSPLQAVAATVEGQFTDAFDAFEFRPVEQAAPALDENGDEIAATPFAYERDGEVLAVGLAEQLEDGTWLSGNIAWCEGVWTLKGGDEK